MPRRISPDRHGKPATGGDSAPGFAIEGMAFTAPRPAPGLHVVATPIGNLGDITLNALRLLAGADAVVCEDSRVSAKLLTHYGIDTPLIAYHEHNARKVRPRLMARLSDGAALALISDAGTPLVSDPGFRLVREAVEAGVPVTAAPGAAAPVNALVLSALPSDRFFFEGFLPPRETARRKRLKELASIPATLLIFESPHRLGAALADMAEVLGPRPAAIAREMTKRFEEVRRDSLDVLAAQYDGESPKGEIVIAVAPPADEPEASAEGLDALLVSFLGEMSLRDAVAEAVDRTGLDRKQVYARALELKERAERESANGS